MVQAPTPEAASPGVRPPPDPPASATANTDQLDQLPLVVVDLPHPSSRAHAMALKRVGAGDADRILEAYLAMWLGATRGRDLAPELVVIRDSLVYREEAGTEEPAPSVGEGEADGPGLDDASIVAALESVRDDAAAADHLSNAAVALTLLSLTPWTADAATNPPYLLRAHAAQLLAALEDAVEPTRPVLLNRAFLAIAIGGTAPALEEPDPIDEPDLEDFVAPTEVAAGLATELLARDAKDLTARALLSFAQVIASSPADPEPALRTLDPLLDEPATIAVGHDLRGDALMIAASRHRPVSPYQARALATRALNEYDAAIAAGDGAGAFAGRGAALEALGERSAAADAYDTATASVGSPVWAVDAARLRAADRPGEALDRAVSRALQLANAQTPLSERRLVFRPHDLVASSAPDVRGFLGWSVGSGAVPRGLWSSEGGIPPSNSVTFEVGATVIPPVHNELESLWDRFDSPAEVAVELAYRRAILLERPVDVPTALADQVSTRTIGAWESAVRVAAASPGARAGEDALAFVEDTFRTAGEFGRAEAFCRRLLDAASPEHRWRLLSCAGETAYLAGNLAGSALALRQAMDLETDEFRDPILRLQAGTVARAAGDLAAAARLFHEAIAVDTETGVYAAALTLLGELALESQDPRSAITVYELLLAASAAGGSTERSSLLVQAAHNNLGIALLQSVQADPSLPPGCQEQARVVCEDARAHIATARAGDPANPFYLVNVAWASRALGETDRARTELEAAAAGDASLFMARNDSGVLRALSGDTSGAVAELSAALATRPDYDLAAWNLGLIELARGDVARGAGHLAAAVRLDPRLRTASPTFRFDERTYRFTFRADPAHDVGPASGRAFDIATVGFAAISTLVAFQRSISDRVGEALTLQAGARVHRSRRIVPAIRRVQGTLRQRVRLPGRSVVLTPLVALILVTVVASVLHGSTGALGAVGVVTALLAALSAAAAHEGGHAIAALAVGRSPRFVAWWPGVLLGLGLAPLGINGGPFPTSRVYAADRRSLAALLSGVGGNALLALLAYGAFLVTPVPLLRLVAQAQIAAIAYAMLPFGPQEGRALQDRHSLLATAIDLGVIAVGSAFALGII